METMRVAADARRDAAERRAVALVQAVFPGAELVDEDGRPSGRRLPRPGSSPSARQKRERQQRQAAAAQPALLAAARPPGDAHRRLLVKAGEGRARPLSDVERAVLVRLLDEGGRCRWALGVLAEDLFGEGTRPGEVAGPLWQLRAAGLITLAVVDAVADDGPLVDVEAGVWRDGGEARGLSGRLVAPELPGGENVQVRAASSGAQPEGRQDEPAEDARR